MKEINMETREERFRRVATRRTNDILRRIRILGNCANRSTYDYTEEEINRVFMAIEKEIRIAKSKFCVKNNKEFKL